MSTPAHSIHLNSQIAAYLSQLDSIEADFRKLVDSLNDEQLHWSPQPGRWSIAGCLVHLTLTAGKFLPVLDNAIEKGRAGGLFCDGPFTQPGRLINWLIQWTEPPVRFKGKAPRSFSPSVRQPAAEVLRDFERSQRELRDRVRQASGLHLSRIKLSHPALPLLRYTLGQAFAQILAHERRHVWQAWQVRNKLPS